MVLILFSIKRIESFPCCFINRIAVNGLEIDHLVTGGVKSINSFVGNYRGGDYLKLCTFGAMKDSGRADIPNNAKPVRTAVCLMIYFIGDFKEIVT